MTYTVLVVDPPAGLIAAATASASLAVGNATICIDPAVGAVATQAWTNLGLRPRMLDALRTGEAPADVVARVPEWDDDAEYRQVAALTIDGRAAARTGSLASDHADDIVGDGYVVVGNLVTGTEVLEAVAAALDGRDGLVTEACNSEPSAQTIRNEASVSDVASLTRTVMAAMRAGESHGGDSRGRQSAGILVAAITGTSSYPPEFLVDLRVDDDPDPLATLDRLVQMRIATLGEASSGASFSVRTE